MARIKKLDTVLRKLAAKEDDAKTTALAAQATLRWAQRCDALLKALGPEWCIEDPKFDASFDIDHEAGEAPYVEIWEPVYFSKTTKGCGNLGVVEFDWSMLAFPSEPFREGDPDVVGGDTTELWVYEPGERGPLAGSGQTYTIAGSAAYINKVYTKP